MPAIRKILIAVKNPDARRQAGVDKALRVAKACGASVELFHAISTPVFLELQPLTGHSLAELKQESLDLRRKRLEVIVKKARRLGIAASADVEWDFPPHEAIIRRAIFGRADLIIAECHEGRRLKPWLVHLTDWELLRASPLPVLLLKNARPWRKNLVLAAVDPAHTHAKPSRLDALILAQAKRLADRLRGSLHVMHANFPRLFGLALSDPSTDAAMFAATFEQLQTKARKDFTAIAKRAGIAVGRRHLVDADPVYGIPEVARRLRADVVVMGAVSRSGLRRVFIGNTAERVLNDLPCDVLVVKLAKSAKGFPARMRGMRVVAPQAMLPSPI